MQDRQDTLIRAMVRDMEETARLAVVLGANCKRLRVAAGLTQDELARHARNVGLHWTASSVGDFEAGRREPPMKTVALLCLALDNALSSGGRKRTPVTLADLARFDGFVALADECALSGERLTEFFGGKPWRLGAPDVAETATAERVDELLALAPGRAGEYGMQLRAVEEMRRRSGQDEYRMAKRLGIDDDRLLTESFRLWGKTFSEKRDELAGRDANQQKRGRISRELRAQLEKALTDGDD